ncbi:hypothetical protein PIB30_050734 [Stylosanthes scabra]|uniref:Myb/SANT-like domain-containing protein n=1 Tax=Stylosanthes scabra TaxID=79078 RepID=A0ABU6ZGF5_9FABA|nr:hypothetical protein [Stylosanthes scabra]
MQTKRKWTSFEDAKLVECLVELTTTSWKCDNETFKSSYSRQLEKMLHKRIPKCDLRSHPNVNGLFNKSFSHFEELGVVFGKDRAQGGNNAENIAQAIANMEVEREANFSDLQVNENIQVNLDEAEAEFEADSEEPPTPGVVAPDAPSAFDA